MIKQNYLKVSVFLLTVMLVNMNSTSANLFLPQIAHFYKITLGNTSYFLSVYILGFAICTLCGGRLGDLFGKRNIIKLAFIIFSLGSVIIIFSHFYLIALFSRLIQGCGAGFLLSNATASIYQQFPSDKKSFALGMVSAFVGLGISTGPIVGVIFIYYLQWQKFYLFLFLVTACLFGLWTVNSSEISEQPKFQSIQFDYLGLWGIVLSTGLISYIMANLFSLHSKEMLVISFLIICAALMLKISAKYSKESFLTLSIFKYPLFLLGCIIRFALGYCFFSVLMIIGNLLPTIMQFNSFELLKYFLPMTLLTTFTSIISSKIPSQHLKIFCGLLSFAVSFVIMITLRPIAISLALILVGISYGTLYPTTFTMALSSIPKKRNGEATGIYYLFHLIGGACGVGTLGSIINQIHTTKKAFILVVLINAFILIGCWLFYWLYFRCTCNEF